MNNQIYVEIENINVIVCKSVQGHGRYKTNVKAIQGQLNSHTHGN